MAPKRRRQSNEDLHRFGLLTFAGLADMAVRELADAKPGQLSVDRLPNYDLVSFDLDTKQFERLPYMRTAEDIFLLMGHPIRVVNDRSLSELAAIMTHTRILHGLELRNMLFHPKKPKVPTFNCFVKQDRDRSVYRKAITKKMNALVAAAFPRWRNSDPATVELWGLYIDEAVHIGFRLSDNRMRYRGQKPTLREGALRPTIAAALILAAAPRRGELLVDPMCGTGTILSEGIARGNGATFAGGDQDREAVELTTRRLRGYGDCVRLWDAENLPYDSCTIDCIVCNLPFGRQFSTKSKNQLLYPALLEHWIDKLKVDGRMVLLTSDCDTLERVLRSQDLTWREEGRVKVLGVWAKIYRIQKQLTYTSAR